jgi:hypothetical protein
MKRLVPKYAHIKITITSGAAKKTQTQTLCIKNELKFLYKKEQLNTQLYHTHIHNENDRNLVKKPPQKR